jgi:hypothetical protein
MKSNKNLFRQTFKNEFSKESLNPSAIKGASQMIGSLKETEKNDTEKGKGDKIGKSAKKQFVKDLQNDPDYIEFKKNAKYKYRDSDSTFGIPNVDDDPYIEKKRYSRVGKEENKEATGSGSSGAYSAPLFSGEEPVNEEFEKVEATEATGTGSSGAYETPAMWAKSTKKKDWGPSRKPQYKGGSFVSVKKKCTKFPYCNQGDIKALNIYKNESVKEAISRVSRKLNVNETTIKAILEYEIEKISKRKK